MMKSYLLLGTLCLLTALLSAQRINGKFILETTTERAAFTVSVDEQGKPFLVEASNEPAAADQLLRQLEYTLNQANLVIGGDTKRAAFGGLSYAVLPVISGPLGQQHVLPTSITPTGKKTELVWEDALEKGWYPSGTYTLNLQVHLLGDLDCAAPEPKFELSGLRLLTTATTVAGLGLLGAGQLRYADADALYQSYTDEWAAGTLASDPIRNNFKQADEAQEEGNTLTGVGLAATIVGGLGSLVQYLQHRRRKGQYNTYCGGATTPSLSLTPLGYGEGATLAQGISLQYKF